MFPGCLVGRGGSSGDIPGVELEERYHTILTSVEEILLFIDQFMFFTAGPR